MARIQANLQQDRVLAMRQRTLVAITTAIVFTLCWDAARAQDRRVTRAETTGRRLALIVGNNTYPVPLVNAANDARAVDAALRGIGFTTEVVTDATLEAMDRAVDTFVARIQPGDVALFYYSGHGVQVAGENYLIPIDFRGTDTTTLRRRTTSVSELQERLQERGARVRILILDACRDNPYRGARSGAQGLAAYQAEGAIIAYATAAGSTASDNTAGSNGLFTAHFLKALRTPGLGVGELFRHVRQAVSEASNGQQVPWLADGLIGQFAFVPGDMGSIGAPPPLVTSAGSDAELTRREELAYWESVRDSRTAEPFAEYLNRYSENGRFSALARLKIKDLSAGTQDVTVNELAFFLGTPRDGGFGFSMWALESYFARERGVPDGRGAAVVAAAVEPLKTGDVILEVNRQKVRTVDDVVAALRAVPEAKTAFFLLWRSRQEVFVTLTSPAFNPPSTNAGINANILYNQGAIALNANDFAKAKEHFEAAIKADANHAESHFMLGKVLLSLGKPAESMAWFQAYVKIAPTGPNAKVAQFNISQLKTVVK